MSLDNVLQRVDVWRGDNTFPADGNRVPTGFMQLDNLLSGGWRRGALTEILVSQEGIGALSVLMPALARLSRRRRWLAWVAPPYIPYAPALVQAGVDLNHVLMIHARHDADNLWAIEQALRSGTCGATLAWLAGSQRPQTLRRLQLAAEAGNTWGILFRPMEVAREPSPSAVRLQLEPHAHGLQVHVLKHRGIGATGIAGPVVLEEVNHALVMPPSAPIVAGSVDSRRGRGLSPGRQRRARQPGRHP